MKLSFQYFGRPGLIDSILYKRQWSKPCDVDGGWNFTGISFGKTTEKVSLVQPRDRVCPILIEVTITSEGQTASFAGFQNMGLLAAAQQGMEIDGHRLGTLPSDGLVLYTFTLLTHE